MNKNLETEYKDLLDQETSKIDVDALWDRIESALPEKTVLNKETENSEIIDIANRPKKKKLNYKVISGAGTLVAACILGLIFVVNNSNRYKSATPTSTDTFYEATNSETTDSNIMYEAEMPEKYTEAVPDEEAESVEKSDGNMLEYIYPGETIDVTFAIIDDTEDYYICNVIETSTVVPEGTKFYVAKEPAWEEIRNNHDTNSLAMELEMYDKIAIDEEIIYVFRLPETTE